MLHLYGVQDASPNCELKVATTLTAPEVGAVRGMHHHCVFQIDARKLSLVHHGDDFIIAGPRREGRWLMDQIGKAFIVKDRGSLGPRLTEKREMPKSHRVVKWRRSDADGGEAIASESDPRYREVLFVHMVLSSRAKELTFSGRSEEGDT